MLKVIFEIGVCPMLLYGYICFVSVFYCADAADEQKTFEAGSQSSTIVFVPSRNLSAKQTNSTVTIEFNCTAIHERTAIDAIYRNVRRAIIENLNRRKSTTATTTIVVTSSTLTTTTTTPTPTTVTTTTTSTTTRARDVGPNKRKKRRRRQNLSEKDVIYNEEDLRFVKVDPEIYKSEILRMSLLLYREELSHLDFGSLLLKAANDVFNEGILEKEAGLPVVKIYIGLSEANTLTETAQNYKASFLIWPLVAFFVILLLVAIGGFIYWRKTRATTTVAITTATESS